MSDAPSTVGEKDSAAALEQTIARYNDAWNAEGGLVKRKDVYSDSVTILRQVGLLD